MSFVPQGDYRVHPRGIHRRQRPREDPQHHREREGASDDRPVEDEGHIGHVYDGEAYRARYYRTEYAAGQAYQRALHQEKVADLGARAPNGLHGPDLPAP